MDNRLDSSALASKRLVGVISLLFLLGFLILAFFVFRPNSTNGTISSSLSLRTEGGLVQYKLDDVKGSDWQTIATESDLKAQRGEPGADGRPGASGRDGRDGQDGADGISGADGKDGASGANGQDGAAGADGREVQLHAGPTHIQWRLSGDSAWTDLIAYTALKGADGTNGINGTNGKGWTSATYDSATGKVTFVSADGLGFTTGDLRGADGAPGATGSQGPIGLGVPAGGTVGQMLVKSSNNSYETQWTDANTHLIVGAGRPDVPASMDAGTQAKVAAATSGTEFRSTDGPQGAWKWMKQGSAWVVIEGDTGWIVASAQLAELRGLPADRVTGLSLRRINHAVYVKLDGIGDRGVSGSTATKLPIGFLASVDTTIYPSNNIGYRLIIGTDGVMELDRGSGADSGGDYGYLRFAAQSYQAQAVWPTTLSL